MGFLDKLKDSLSGKNNKSPFGELGLLGDPLHYLIGDKYDKFMRKTWEYPNKYVGKAITEFDEKIDRKINPIHKALDKTSFGAKAKEMVHNKPGDSALAIFGAIYGGGALLGGGGGGAAGGGAAGEGAVGWGGAGTGGFSGASDFSLAGVGGGNAGSLAASGGISGGAGTGGAYMGWMDMVTQGLGAISSLSGGGGSSKSYGSSQSTQSVFLSDYFNQLYGGANQAAKSVDVEGLRNTSENLYGQGVGFLSGLQQQALGSDPSGQYLQNRLSADNSIVDAQVGALGTDLGNFFNQQLMPGIQGNAIGAGQLGGGRQGVAQGLAAQSVAQQFASGAANIRSQDQAQRLQAAGMLGQQQGNAGVSGLNALSGLYGLASSGFNASFDPYQQLAAILGGPTTLTQAASASGSKASEKKYGISFSEGK